MKAPGLLLLFALIAIAADKKIPAWPQYRGPGGSGVAADGDDPPIEFGPAKHVLWKTAVPAGHSSPSIWGNRIFLTTFDKQTEKLEVMALDRRRARHPQRQWQLRGPLPTERSTAGIRRDRNRPSGLDV